MIRLRVICEGTTEAYFVERILIDSLSQHGVMPSATKLGPPGHKGGRVNWQRVRGHVTRLLLEDRHAFVTTFFDYFRMETDMPGYRDPGAVSTGQKKRSVEEGMRNKLLDADRGSAVCLRFIPYVQMHEFEGLLFSDPTRMANGMRRPEFADDFMKIRLGGATPEDINDSPQTAPSKRIESIFSGYGKTVHGPAAAEAVGLAAMRRECPFFHDWVSKLEALANS